jgi:hypothetical protein
MATADPTRRTGPPKPGSRPSIRVDDDLAADLAVIMQTGLNLSDAIRTAVRQAADICRTGWAHGVCPPDTMPILRAYSLAAVPGWKPPATSGYDAPSDAQPRLVGPPPFPSAGPAIVGGSTA